MGFLHKLAHTEAHLHRDRQSSCISSVLVACYITVMEDHEGDFLASLDFLDVFRDQAAPAFHSNAELWCN